MSHETWHGRQRDESGAEASPVLRRAVALLRVELADPAKTRRTIEQLFELLSGYLSSDHGQDPQTRRALAARSEASSRQILRALELMHADPARRWTLQRLAKACGVSRAVLSRRFVAALGTPPLRYLTELRLRRAAELLVSTDASLAEIASHVGYHSEFAFNRAFKRLHGLPPGVFRRRRICVSGGARSELRAAA